MTRREFLKRAGQTALLTTGATFDLPSALAVPASPRPAGDWPMYRGNRCLTGHAVLPGEMRRAPEVSWRHKIEAGLVWAVLDPAPDKSSRRAEVRKSDLNYFQSPEGRKWELGAKWVDLYGTGQLVPDPGRAAKLLPDVPGLQTIEFHPVPDASGIDPKRAVCFAYDGGQKREVWRSETYDTIQNTNFAIADIDHDGRLEVILAPHYRLIVYDGQTGRTKHLLKIHDSRNYGFLCCTDLTGDGLLDFVIIADFAMHVDVVRNDGDQLRLLWRRELEKDIQSKNIIVRPGPNPVFDVNGDGRKEILFNLFNQSGDGKWHVMAYDALTGDTVLDLPEQYLNGAADVNGDGVSELFTARTSTLHVPDAAELSLLRVKSSDALPLWKHPRARWVTAPAVLPLTHTTIVARGTDDVVTANLTGHGKANFFVLETATRKSERLVALAVNGDRAIASVCSLELPRRSRAQIRSWADVDGDGKDEVLVSFRQPSAERARPGQARNGAVRVVSLETTKVPQQTVGAGEIRPLVAASTSARSGPVILFEGADDDIISLTPPMRRGQSPIEQWRKPGAGAPVIADVDGDGVAEVVFADWSETGEGVIVA
ncbi:MAG TPA: VCBS repeat-containing protein, partial [Verrucomicrobiae bacterium]|nr:VCBS repeat-containing protein [Verrucomicrobiae bacterium]